MNVVILHFMSPAQMKDKALHGIVLIVERIYMGRKKMLTSEEYAAKEGGCCPKCGSKDVTGEQFDVEAGCAWQTVSCDDCDFEWDDSYKLMGFYAFNGGGKDA